MFRLFLKHRDRISFRNLLKLFLFQIKRVFKIRNTPEWYGLKEYFIKLVKLDGKQKDEDGQFYYTELNSLQFKLRKRPSSDISVFGQIFEEEEYRAVIECYIQSFKAEPVTIIDAGANIGLTALYFHRKLKTLKILCVEPDDDNFEVLKYNIENNAVNATLHKAGLWNKNTNLTIVNDFRDKKEWSVRVKESLVGGLKAITVNSLLKEKNWEYIDILKVDIEGAEKEVFTTNEADISFLKKTKCIAIEIHDEFNCREDINKILKANNFNCFKTGELTIGINKNFLIEEK
ncbi:FkbM family methyltransferase [Jejuia pallidilutea]|uniref:FkbM family methyltransferase n=1 Tax=Jejuia pallidilutea TaxID=504487 RepID=A0A362X4K9_9FLAO|nr:FkbM family methyltransferase [Jejuia pallidilutea]